MARDTTETKNWEASVSVVGLHNLANVHKTGLVLVLTTQVVERAAIRWISIGSRIIDGTHQGDSPSWSKILNETWPHVDFRFTNSQRRSLCIEVLSATVGTSQISNRSNVVVKLDSVWSIAISDQGKLDSCGLVSITYLCKRMNLRRYGYLSLGRQVICRVTHSYHKATSIGNLFKNLEVERWWSRAHAHASWHACINISPVNAHLDDLICLLDSLCANDNRAAFALTLVRQLCCVNLLLGTH